MDKTSYKIAVGNRDTILLFKLIGFQTFPVKRSSGGQSAHPASAGREDFYLSLTEDMAAEIFQKPWPVL